MRTPEMKGPPGKTAGRGESHYGRGTHGSDYIRNDADRAREALQYIPANTARDEWAKICFACIDAGLGFKDFADWSATAENYDARDCVATWRSCERANGSGITVASIFYEAAKYGWRDNPRDNRGPVDVKPREAAPEPPQAPPSHKPGMSPAEVWARCEAATEAHAYIAKKGAQSVPLDGLRVLPADDSLTIAGHPMAGALVVPAYADGQLQSLQFVPPEGPKMNLPGCRMAGVSFTVGRVEPGKPTYVCEGFGQAAAIWQATGCAAVVSFGCSNMATVARGLAGDVVLVADGGQERKATDTARDLRCKVAFMPAGEASNFDACDLMQRDGIEALRAVLASAQSFAPPAHPLTVCVDLDFTPHPPRWILPGLIAEGVCIVAGMRDVGKTTALLPLALAAAGLHEPGYPLAPAHWRHVVYVTEDTGQALRILAGLCEALNLPRADVAERFHLVEARRMAPDDLVLAGDTLRERYSRTVAAVELPPLVVLDTQSATIELESENDNAEAGRAIASLKQRFAGLPVWLIAHVAKTMSRENLTARGASAFESDAHQVLYLVTDDDGTRYLLTGKTRFEPRWRELKLESYTSTTAAENCFGEFEQLTLRWSIARPVEQGERAKAREAAREESAKQAETELRGAVLDAVEAAWTAGNPLPRSALPSSVGRNKQAVTDTIEKLLAEGWLLEVEVPARQRTNAKRARFLVRLASGEREAMLQGEPAPEEKMAIPASWRKADSVCPEISEVVGENGPKNHE